MPGAIYTAKIHDLYVFKLNSLVLWLFPCDFFSLLRLKVASLILLMYLHDPLTHLLENLLLGS